MALIIRKEKPQDWLISEFMTKKAFWNLHVPGCNEHYLLHLLRESKDYVEAFSRVAEVDGEIVGGIWYTKAYVLEGEKKTEVLTFGPLCVEPAFQNTGIGGKLLEYTMELARKAGHQAIIIYGEPGYYPKHGFKTCDHFGITTPNGKNFDAFMGIELVPNALKEVKGKFYESELFDHLDPKKVDEYDKRFPYMEKLKLPGQWNR